MKKIIGVMAVAVLLIAGLIAPATADTDNTCKDLGFSDNLTSDSSGDWGEITFSDQEETLTLVVNEGWEVELCVKAGSSSQEDGGPETKGPFSAGTHEVDHSSGKELSHYAYKAGEVEPEPEVCSDLVDDPDHPDRVVEEGEDPEVVCFEEETGTSLSLTLEKAWDVTDEDDLWDEAEASYTLLLDGAEFTGPIEVDEGDEVEIGEEDVTVPEGCDFIGSDARTYVVDADDADEDGLITLTLTNEVECAEVEGVVIVDDDEDEDDKEPEKKKVTEVLDEVLEDDEDELPRTGVPVLVLALLGLTALGSGGAILRRR